MVTSKDVADFYIDLFRDSKEPMTRMRIHKFLYFAQGWSMTRFGKPLFDDDFKALRHGPVMTSLDINWKENGSKPIRTKADKQLLSVFTVDQVQLLLDVAEKYSSFDTDELAHMTHEAGGAWDKNHVEGKSNPLLIPKEDIKEEFEIIRNSEGDLPDFFTEECKRKAVKVVKPVEGSPLSDDWE